ncbi:hypothetical protein PV332_10325 [Streptomyces scabiei]|uniref:hypothetical protein n=1 Tax=Streptomyces scabiei TaxID=1930 RepID=UPI0029ACA626|nr:hypothetical protein [Streptomyces scabiei]MDX2575879.1 hypothetical protein [Streptomyces scabiei]MDX2885648.1 hypothetical protein [Streptomyces scabiei]MDX2998004.1 hypothetical protein [Streptomyces scabiei]MDX3033446.1 hypothetical protein [Streptomyces scabiei]MDX3051625.1 hypothetical protein [Streptomyces scabiei]
MSLVVCSLKWEAAVSGPQRITYDADGYHLVRFPYVAEVESYDPWEMHDPACGGVAASTFPDARSGLIWPSHAGWAVVSALAFWASDNRATEYRARFVRNPLGTAKSYDSTATSDSAGTRGGEFRTYMWQMFVEPGTPLGFKVSARDSEDDKIDVPLTLAEFKMAIHTDVKTP